MYAIVCGCFIPAYMRRLSDEFRRQKTSLTLKPETWPEFKKTCHKLGLSASAQLESLMLRWVKRQRKKQ